MGDFIVLSQVHDNYNFEATQQLIIKRSDLVYDFYNSSFNYAFIEIPITHFHALDISQTAVNT